MQGDDRTPSRSDTGPATSPLGGPAPGPVAEVVTLASDLIAIDTTNDGDPDTQGTERAAAEYVAEKLAEVGYEPTYVESGGRGRGNVIVRLPGSDPARGALLVHGHLDVVPADASEWTVHPFSGEVADGYVWGRGAVDMKGMVAMTLAVARGLRREGVAPPRDLVLAFLADEEAGGKLGARWLVEHRPELFEGVTEAIGEAGGFSIILPAGRNPAIVDQWVRWEPGTAAGPGRSTSPARVVASPLRRPVVFVSCAPADQAWAD
ncbi:hypothetical protein FRACA_60066 [Frankia canadensis]|uniref:M20/M25/M40 family metallo-hydrolase n=1 Tax=Frankia canadensis TaxID=1836972 RepID=A0A2I2KZJ9_9ACTN|nr:hypothetical protein FRACA_60066 [Frankia canadensis]SOU58370.1 hypothetical protein FRACA_60066 [Frankia canadensis]